MTLALAVVAVMVRKRTGERDAPGTPARHGAPTCPAPRRSSSSRSRDAVSCSVRSPASPCSPSSRPSTTSPRRSRPSFPVVADDDRSIIERARRATTRTLDPLVLQPAVDTDVPAEAQVG
ncbi:MAG: hypothetical protein R2705_12840 [Ilumatobacteraceae bacterium]